jgi:hypothetical protein
MTQTTPPQTNGNRSASSASSSFDSSSKADATKPKRAIISFYIVSFSSK